jgi:hypothetical protein
MGLAPQKAFYVNANESGDYYAVAKVDCFVPENEHRIEVVTYNRQHEEVSRAWYEGPENNFKYVDFKQLLLAGSDVIVTTFCYNKKKDPEKGSVLLISKLKEGGKVMEHMPVKNTRNINDEIQLRLEFNKERNLLQMLILTLIDEKQRGSIINKTYGMIYCAIDPQSMTSLYARPVATDKAVAYAAQHLDDKIEINGMPLGMMINKDGSATVILEEKSTVNGTNIGLSAAGDLVLLEMNEQGVVGDASMVRFRQADGDPVPFRANYRRTRGAYISGRSLGLFAANPGFFSIDYISTANGRYLLFNDDEDNIGREETKKAQIVKSVSESSAVYYKISGEQRERDFLFGKPDKTFDHRFAQLNSGDYNKALNQYAVIMVEKNGRKKTAHLAWITFN